MKSLSHNMRVALIATAGAIAVIVATFSLVSLADYAAPKEGRHFEVTPGGCEGTSFSAGVRFTAESLPAAKAGVRLKVEIEYRDLDGRLVDTDETYVTVPRGETVVHSETTLLGALADDVRTCHLASVRASWN